MNKIQFSDLVGYCVATLQDQCLQILSNSLYKADQKSFDPGVEFFIRF